MSYTAKIKKVEDAKVTYFYYVITRKNHTDIYSNNYKSEKMAKTKLNNRLKKLKLI